MTHIPDIAAMAERATIAQKEATEEFNLRKEKQGVFNCVDVLKNPRKYPHANYKATANNLLNLKNPELIEYRDYLLTHSLKREEIKTNPRFWIFLTAIGIILAFSVITL